MTLTIDTTVGGVSANSYLSVADAQAYFDARPNSEAWDDADDQTQALIAATARFDLEQFAGYKTDVAQRLKWPRYETYDDDGNVYDSAAIPQRVKDAVCELALDMLRSGTTDTQAASGLEQFDQITIGSISLTPSKLAPVTGSLPAIVLRLMRGLLYSTPGVTRLERG